VRAACAIREAVHALNAERVARGEPPLAVGIGINTGPAVAGNLGTPGRLSYTVVGQSVNVAARLCSLAEAGEILVSAAIFHEVRERVEATHCGPQMLKGLTAPIEVHAIDGLLPSPAAESPSSDPKIESESTIKSSSTIESASAVESSSTIESASDVAPASEIESASVIESASRSGSASDGDSSSDSGASSSPESASASDAAKTVGGAATAVVLALSAALAAEPATAQNLPTLEELGIGWTSADGAWQVMPGGRIDLEGFFPQSAPAGLVFETEPFVAPRVSVFVDVLAGRHVYGSLELRADRGEAPSSGDLEARVEQAFVRLIPSPARNLHLQLGRFVSPFGAYPQRHHSPADAFIRPPLSYDHRTMVSAADLPGGPDGFVGWKDEPEEYRPIGAPVVWAAPYQVGAMAAGGWKGLSARVAVMNSAPSSEPREWNAVSTEHGPSLVAHVGTQVTPELRVGASYNTGSYVWDRPAGAPFPAGRDAGDYAQEIWGFEASFARGPVEARGELFLDRWQVPNVADDARDVSYYVESKVKLSPGLFAAARYGALRFNEIRGSDGVRRAWDYDVDRLQLAAGYRLTRTTEVRAEYLATFTAAPPHADDDLLAVRWTYVF
jgi:Adenylate and Guanylate cyclase catalytic domain